MENETKLEFIVRNLNNSTDDCIIVPGKRTMDGYSHLNFNGRLRGAHRVALILATGRDPDGMHACHRCNVRNCVNVKHLYFGTAEENTDDRLRCGSAGKKLTPDLVMEIYRLSQLGMRSDVLAVRFNVSRGTVSGIASGRMWSAVTGAVK